MIIQLSAKALEDAVGRWFAAADKDFRSFDAVGTVFGRWKECTREAGPRFIWRPAIGPIAASAGCGSDATMAWRRICGWLSDLLKIPVYAPADSPWSRLRDGIRKRIR